MNFSETPQDQRVDPMVFVFPRVTKCIFHKYGASGSIQKHDSLCILPLNIVNEKTYIFIWFWYIILAVMLIGLLVYRCLIIFVPSIRAKVLNARNRMVPREIAYAVSKKTDIGDWWIIYMLGRNLDPIIYKDVLAELAKQIQPKKKPTRSWIIYFKINLWIDYWLILRRNFKFRCQEFLLGASFDLIETMNAFE